MNQHMNNNCLVIKGFFNPTEFKPLNLTLKAGCKYLYCSCGHNFQFFKQKKDSAEYILYCPNCNSNLVFAIKKNPENVLNRELVLTRKIEEKYEVKE